MLFHHLPTMMSTLHRAMFALTWPSHNDGPQKADIPWRLPPPLLPSWKGRKLWKNIIQEQQEWCWWTRTGFLRRNLSFCLWDSHFSQRKPLCGISGKSKSLHYFNFTVISIALTSFQPITDTTIVKDILVLCPLTIASPDSLVNMGFRNQCAGLEEILCKDAEDRSTHPYSQSVSIDISSSLSLNSLLKSWR